MKDHLRALALRADDDLARTSLVREYLQARILESLQDQGVFLRWAFLGGTALRFLFAIPRFSEDLDFSVISPGPDAEMTRVLTGMKRTFTAEGYAVDIRLNDQKTVASVWVKFPGLLHELDLSPQASRVLSIKLELDTNPPPGARTETSIVRRHVTLNLCHHDRASLLAGKVHAVLSRPWAKGRDVFDLVWYLADRSWPEPNLDLLNAALKQTRWRGPNLTSQDWKAELRRRVEAMDWKRVQDDVRPFLERPRDIDLVTLESLRSLLPDSTVT